ncbi:hypothetical protein KR038_003912, partial [Drosophila bunnanda]
STMLKHVFKILIIGDEGVGKSSLLRRFTEDQFTRDYHQTTGIELKYHRVEQAGKGVLLHIRDSADGEHCRAMLQIHYRNCHGVIIVYDTTSLSSFRNLNSWLKDLGDHCCRGVTFMLVGTKCDRRKERLVTHQRAYRYADFYGLYLVEASAASGANVKDIFEILTGEVYNRMVLKLVPSPEWTPNGMDDVVGYVPPP